MPSGLAIHTSSPVLGLAVQTSTQSLQAQTWDLGRDLSYRLHDYLANFMVAARWSELEFIVVAVGPGGFTGTRLGVVTARTLAQQLDLPLFGILTLAAVAWQARGEELGLIAVDYPARRGDIFGGIYPVTAEGIDWQGSIHDRLYTPEAWAELRSQYPIDQHIAAPAALGETVQSLWELGAIAYQQGERPHWSTVIPFYGQNPVN